MDKLIKYLDHHFRSTKSNFNSQKNDFRYANERQTSGSLFNLFYSTPSCYVKALNDLNRSWSSKTDDFFPYGSDAHSYWTGYFTSRPALKFMVREAGSLLQSCKQAASVLDRKGAAMEGDISTLKEAMSIMQHTMQMTAIIIIQFNYSTTRFFCWKFSGWNGETACGKRLRPTGSPGRRRVSEDDDFLLRVLLLLLRLSFILSNCFSMNFACYWQKWIEVGRNFSARDFLLSAQH